MVWEGFLSLILTTVDADRCVTEHCLHNNVDTVDLQDRVESATSPPTPLQTCVLVHSDI